MSSSDCHSRTLQLSAGLQLVETDSQGALLRIEKKLHDALMNLEFSSLGGSIPPIACVNEGNSDLSDVVVTVLATEKETGSRQKVSMMVQAKDYHGSSTPKMDLKTAHINHHAEKNSEELLDRVFRKMWLLCMASTHDAMMTKQPVMHTREFRALRC